MNEWTLGPRGPLLQRGVVVVLQSEQTRTVFLLLWLLVIKEWTSILSCSCRSFCATFADSSWVPVLCDDELIILFISLILEDIHSPDDGEYEPLSLVLPSPTSLPCMASLLFIILLGWDTEDWGSLGPPGAMDWSIWDQVNYLYLRDHLY